MSEDCYDYIVVGQGMAGSCLAHQLLEINKKILVYDVPENNFSSTVAAGIYNPITGRNLVKTWMADELFPYLTQFYSSIEKESNTRFLNDKTIYRPFLNPEEQNDWMGRSSDPLFSDYIKKIDLQPKEGNKFNDAYGGLYLQKSGYLNIPIFLGVIQSKLQAIGAYKREFFEVEALEIKEEEVAYKGIRSKKLVFCDGVGGAKVPYFEHLPYKHVKGELLEIETEGIPEYIVNRGVFMLHKENNTYKVGATYENTELHNGITEKGKNQLVKKLAELYKNKYRITNHLSGIRPATKDRKPFVGLHPKHKVLGIFNGLGAKGVSLAPWLSSHYVQHLEFGSKLNREIDIIRYLNLLI